MALIDKDMALAITLHHCGLCAREIAKMPDEGRPRLMSLEELRAGRGSGWEETRFISETGRVTETYWLKCAWAMGWLITEEGCNANLNDADVTRSYNCAGSGWRIWRGDRRPTEEEEAAEEWRSL